MTFDDLFSIALHIGFVIALIFFGAGILSIPYCIGYNKGYDNALADLDEAESGIKGRIQR